MPEKTTLKRARRDARQGKAPSTQAGLGDDTPFLKGLSRRLDLTPATTRNLKSGKLLMVYHARQATSAAPAEREDHRVLQTK